MKKRAILTFILIGLLLTTMPLAALAQSETGNAYRDISGTWFEDAAKKYGYTEVFSDGSENFNGHRAITRIEFVQLLHRALNTNINYFVAPNMKDYFNDMDNAATGANALIDLVTIGIIERGGNFYPDQALVREEMIHWIMNALQYKTDGNYPIPMVKPVPFRDDGDISANYRGEIYSAVVLKLVSGRGDTMLFPKDAATRAEAVTIVANLMRLLENRQSLVQATASAQLAKDGSLTMSLTLKNNTDKEVTIQHTSGQKYDFKLFDLAGNNVYTWSADKLFAAVMNETQIGPGEVIVFSDTLDHDGFDVPNSAVTMKAYIVGTSKDFVIDTTGYASSIVKQ